MKPITLIFLSSAILASLAGAQPRLNQMTLVGQYVGEGYDNYFGSGTAIGDFDDDGYGEFIIGAGGWNSNAGKNYYYDGDGSWPGTYLWTFQGDCANSFYDLSDQDVGDINNDGIEDFGLSESRPGLGNGRLHVFYGGADFDSLPDFSFVVDSACGITVSLDSCGDVNGDGFEDMIVMSHIGTNNSYTAQIYFGGEVLETIPDWQYFPNEQYVYCDGLGDINGDGYDDVIIMGAVTTPPLIFFGGNSMDTIPDWMIFNIYAMFSANQTAAIGDVNDDGYNDFSLCTLPSYSRSIFFGAASVDTIPDAFLLNELGGPAYAPYLSPTATSMRMA